MTRHSFESPFSSRYASPEIQQIFSPQFKHSSWRRLWVALAEGQKELGLPIQDNQIQEMKQNVDNINFDKALEYEKQLQHDVMAHIHAFADLCPTAKPIIHLGATSCYVTDNTEIIQMRRGLEILIPKLKRVLKQLAAFAKQYAALPCLGFTHFQPAQLTTVGKRACLWLQELLIDFHELQNRNNNLRFLGVKGTTGTQASFLSLFKQDQAKVKALDEIVSKKMGFPISYIISGQTYTRKQDMQIVDALSGMAVSAHKFATDIRLLAHLKEIEEPFLEKQVGSSAMPYKRNPILSERICGLARYLISLRENPAYTAATQWLERSLDDSSNRRVAIPDAFLAADAILLLLIDLTKNLVVYPQVIDKHIQEELPFMATENILMASVMKGGNRQELHEKLRQLTQKAGTAIKQEGKKFRLLDEIAQDSDFRLSFDELKQILDVKAFIGRAPQQVEEFLASEVDPLLEHS
jgi:adenylosuccinate lyase